MASYLTFKLKVKGQEQPLTLVSFCRSHPLYVAMYSGVTKDDGENIAISSAFLQQFIIEGQKFIATLENRIAVMKAVQHDADIILEQYAMLAAARSTLSNLEFLSSIAEDIHCGNSDFEALVACID